MASPLDRRAVALVGLAVGLAVVPTWVERARAPRPRFCQLGARTARCAWLAGERPPLHRALPEDVALVLEISAGRGAGILAVVGRACPEGAADLRSLVGEAFTRRLMRFFRLEPECGPPDEGVGEDGT